MPRGASPKREREYKELKHNFERSGRYGNRAEEVAARIVNKQRKEYGETKGEKKKDSEGKSLDRNLPISNYQHRTVADVNRRLKDLSKSELRQIESYERKHKDRKGVLQAISKQRSS